MQTQSLRALFLLWPTKDVCPGSWFLPFLKDPWIPFVNKLWLYYPKSKLSIVCDSELVIISVQAICRHFHHTCKQQILILKLIWEHTFFGEFYAKMLSMFHDNELGFLLKVVSEYVYRQILNSITTLFYFSFGFSVNSIM